METIWQDIKYGIRMLGKNKSFTVIAAITLALGIGLNTALFSVVNAVLFKPLPVDKPEQLAGIYNREKFGFVTHTPMAYPDYADIRDRSKSFSNLTGYALIQVAIDKGGESDLSFGEIVSGNYFDTLGIKPVVGRGFLPEEDRTKGSHLVTVLSYGTWQRRFGGDPNVTSKTIRLNGHTFNIVGVAPQQFTGMIRALVPELWVPMMTSGTLNFASTMSAGDIDRNKDRTEQRGARWMNVVGRLKPGVTIQQATAEVLSIGQRLKEEYPETNKDREVDAVPANSVVLLPGLDRALYATSYVLLGVVGLVLLIASANVANMLLARAAARRREIAVRLSLGAGRSRIMRQLLTESLLLAFFGGGLGLLLAGWSNSLLNQMKLPLPIQLALGLSLDWRVLAYTMGIAMVTAVAFGLAPAWQATKTDLVTSLKEESGTTAGGASRRRLQSGLVIAQVALSLVLLIGAGLSVRSMRNAHNMNPGFNSAGIAMAEFHPRLRGYTNEQSMQFYRQMEERIRALPGVQNVAYASHLPLTFNINIESVAPEGKDVGRDRDWPDVDSATVGVNYFATMSVPILQGREFNEKDTPEAPRVVIVNETLTKRFWPGQDPIGKRVRFGEKDKDYYQVVGVARDGKYRTLGEDPLLFAYRAATQFPGSGSLLLVHTAGDTRAVLAQIRLESRQLDERMPVSGLETAEESLQTVLLFPQAGAALFGLFGVLGLVLASLGLYGVIAYGVSQRTHEIGIRMALGAQRADVLKMIVTQGLRLVSFGVVVGLVGAWGFTRLITVMLYGVSATDAVTFGGVTITLLAVALVACLIPARRAAAIEPMQALRYQ
ncbi:MAG: ABC transporter permease [Acidobacteria bacterium]|nr:ABC transporter permease [Acidobacteriota bacterium]